MAHLQRIHFRVQETQGSISGLGRSHMLRGYWGHAPQLLTVCSRAQKPQLLNPLHPRVSSQTSYHEKPARHGKEGHPLSATRDKPEQQQRPSTVKNNKLKNKVTLIKI